MLNQLCSLIPFESLTKSFIESDILFFVSFELEKSFRFLFRPERTLQLGISVH